MTLQERLELLDTSLLARIERQTTEPDRWSPHAVIAGRGPFDSLDQRATVPLVR